MSSWTNIVKQSEPVKIKRKIEEIEIEENYDEEILEIKKEEYFLDNFSSSISDLFQEMKQLASNERNNEVLNKLNNSYKLQKFIYNCIDYEEEWENVNSILDSEESNDENYEQ